MFSYVNIQQMKSALTRHVSGRAKPTAKVIKVICRPCVLPLTPLHVYQHFRLNERDYLGIVKA